MDTDGSDAQVPDPVPSLTIGELSRRTGLSRATLRIWETRHGFPEPHRLDSGHRRYDESDVRTIARVLRHRDAGTRLELAIARAMADAAPASPSVYAQLRRTHPHLGVHRLRKRTLLALSWAIEDEFCAKADRAVIWGGFQTEARYRGSRSRWRELARVAQAATVLADFADPDLDADPAEVGLPDDAPMLREWLVVCDAVDLPVVLTAWELPGQDGVADGDRLFESVWTVEPTAVRSAATVCAAVSQDAGGPAPTRAGPPSPAPDPLAVTALFNRMVAYVDRMEP